MYMAHYEHVLSQIIKERGGLTQEEESNYKFFGASALNLTSEQLDRLAAAWEYDEYPAAQERERLDSMYRAGVFD